MQTHRSLFVSAGKWLSCSNAVTKLFKVNYSSGVLSDVRILDLTRVLAGPFCTQFLADLGAHVIKLEKPGTGDETRGFGPPFFPTQDGQDGNASYFYSVNRNKQSIAVDLKKGKDLVQQLIGKCDVFIENYVPGVMDRLGLGYEDLTKINPRLIYCSISGFGSDSNRPGYDVIASSVAGLLSITGPEDGEPCRPGIAVVDIITGLYASNAILTAIINQRKREEKASCVKIEVDLISSQISILGNVALNYLNFGHITHRGGSAHDSIVPYQAFACKKVTENEDWVTVGAGSDPMFQKLIRTIFDDDEQECEQMIADPRFKNNSLRVKHRKLLISIIQKQFRKRTQEEWLQKLDGKGFPFGPVNRIDQVFSDQRILDRNVFEIQNRDRKLKLLRNAVRFVGDSPYHRSDVQCPREKVGQDTEDVLKSVLNMEQSEIESLKNQKVIF